ncbi:MAG: DUF6525 family protein [Pseudomonadota bacterium]
MTSLKRRRRAQSDPMGDYDNLPAVLRGWVARAMLPWRPASVRRSFNRALAKTGDPALALAELDDLQRRLIARDAPQVWGEGHPCAVTSPG